MKLDLTGQRFGKLTVIERGENKGKYTTWICKCDCGNIKRIRTDALRSGVTVSCGKHQLDHLKNRQYKYPQDVRNRRIRNVWHGMMRRCNDEKDRSFKNYGGRGIKVCEEWNDYVSFARWAMRNGYSRNLTLDRIDNDGNYEPSNCKWSTQHEQRCNKQNSRRETINGITKTVSEWAKEYGVHPNTVYRRLDRGISINNALRKGRFKKGNLT